MYTSNINTLRLKQERSFKKWNVIGGDRPILYFDAVKFCAEFGSLVFVCWGLFASLYSDPP